MEGENALRPVSEISKPERYVHKCVSPDTGTRIQKSMRPKVSWSKRRKMEGEDSLEGGQASSFTLGRDAGSKLPFLFLWRGGGQGRAGRAG